MEMYMYLELNSTNDFYKAIELKELEVYKYEFEINATKIKIKDKTQEDNFQTNLIRIAYATARTLCSFHADNKELYFDVISSILSHLNFIEPNDHRTSFLLKRDRLNRLRDFSQTGRTGELAQGINYLFVQERLDYPFIIDYHLFCDRLSITIDGRTPDFVLLDKNLTKIGLFESKGEAAILDTVKGKLSSAMKQLVSGKQNLLLNKRYILQYGRIH